MDKAPTIYHVTAFLGQKCQEPGCISKYDYIELENNKAIIQCLGMHSRELTLEFTVNDELRRTVYKKNIRYPAEHLYSLK